MKWLIPVCWKWIIRFFLVFASPDPKGCVGLVCHCLLWQIPQTPRGMVDDYLKYWKKMTRFYLNASQKNLPMRWMSGLASNTKIQTQDSVPQSLCYPRLLSQGLFGLDLPRAEHEQSLRSGVRHHKSWVSAKWSSPVLREACGLHVSTFSTGTKSALAY